MSKKKKIIMLVLVGIMLLILLAAVIAYLAYKPEKPWMAFFILCGSGIILLNFCISLFFIHKNLK